MIEHGLIESANMALIQIRWMFVVIRHVAFLTVQTNRSCLLYVYVFNIHSVYFFVFVSFPATSVINCDAFSEPLTLGPVDEEYTGALQTLALKSKSHVGNFM